MDFVSFLILLIISAAVSWVLHEMLGYYVTAGWWSYLSKVVVGWFGAWLGTPIFGRWFPGMEVNGIYIIPAIIGAFAILIVAVDIVRMTNKSGNAVVAKSAKRR
jgi:uncharacterized membrane protein YeaQ/YmgE (transglycosylase-associated protein family)